jgi:hypothetical protein
MTPLPKPDIQTAVEALRDREEFKAILEFIIEEREKFISDQRMCRDPYEVMKLVGSIATLDELHSILTDRE